MKLDSKNAKARIGRIAAAMARRQGLNTYRQELAAAGARNFWDAADVPTLARDRVKEGAPPAAVIVGVAHAVRLFALEAATHPDTL